MFIGSFWRFFYWKALFILCRSLSENLIAFFSKSFWTWFSKMHSTCPKDSFDEKFVFFFKKKRKFLNVLWHWAKNCRPAAEIFFFLDCKKCKRSVYRKVLTIFSKNFFFYHPLKLIEKNPRFMRIFPAELSKLLPSCEQLSIFEVTLRVEEKKFDMWFKFSAELSKKVSVQFFWVNLFSFEK